MNERVPEVYRNRHGVPVLAVCGWKNSGKTTLTVRLVEEFTRRGYRVATVKHAHHSFSIDEGHQDSARHRAAGAQEVAIISGTRTAFIKEIEPLDEPDLPDVLDWFEHAGLIVVEGYKSSSLPKIEARRKKSVTHVPMADDDLQIFAIAADHPVDDAPCAVYDLDDVAGLADRALAVLGLQQRLETAT